MVHWLYEHAHLRCLGRVRSADHDRRTRLRRCSGVARVDAGDEQSVAALSGRAVATHHATRTREGLFDFQSTRHHRMHVGRNRLRHRFTSRQGADFRLPSAWWFAMAICSAGAKWASESAYVAGRLLQIFQAILRTLTSTVIKSLASPFVVALVSSVWPKCFESVPAIASVFVSSSTSSENRSTEIQKVVSE